jgi:hypothetical protein
MKRKLFLDDERLPYDSSWDVVRSFNSFVEYIERNGVPDIISFDHDLASEHYPGAGIELNPLPYDKYQHKTGYHAALWLLETGKIDQLKEAWVHSMNPVGRVNIMNVLMKARVETLYFVGWRQRQRILLPIHGA